MKKNNVKVLQDKLDDLVEMYGKLIDKFNFNEALNVMKNIEIIIRQLQILGENVVTGDYTFKTDWYDILKFFIEKKQSQLIQLDYVSHEKELVHRGTGKTTTLFKLSNDYRIPILVKNYEKEHEELENFADKLGLHIIVVDTRMLNKKQFEKIDILLVDENTDMSNIVFRGSNILKTIIGFEIKK